MVARNPPTLLFGKQLVGSDYAIAKHHVRVVFIPQVTALHHKDDDRDAGQRVFDLMVNQKDAVVMHDRVGHHEIKAMYASLDFIVGTRFHSVILALTANVPAIAIEYEHKTRGIMRDLSLEQWVLPIEHVTADQLNTLFDKFVASKPQYVDQLQRQLPAYIARAENNLHYISAAYRAHVKRTTSTS